MRMVSTSLDELATLLPADLGERPRFGADERPAAPHILLVLDGVELPPGNHVVPHDGVHGVTVLDLPVRWDELQDSTRLRLQLEGEPLVDGRYAVRALRLREETVRAKVDQCPLPQAEAFARRLTPLHTVGGGRADRDVARRRRATSTSWSCWRSATSAPSTPTRPGGPGPPGTGCGCRSAPRTPARWSTSTSRSPPSRAWARTGW